jgi:hypothetical protein
MTRPPSTDSTAPVMNFARSDARKTYASAMSCGSPTRPSGVRSRMASITFSGMSLMISVPMKPGATAFTRMP